MHNRAETMSRLDKLARLHFLWRSFNSDMSDVYVGGEGECDRPEAIIIGEAPGAQEEIRARPFVGPAGIVLRQLMLMANLATEDWQSEREYGVANCWLTNVVKFRPPGNRTPTPAEISSVRKLLRMEWNAVGQPEIIIPVGGVALQALYGRRISSIAVGGKLHCQMSATVPGKRLYIWPMVHPSYGLRSGSTHIQELLERDWQKLGRWINGSNR